MNSEKPILTDPDVSPSASSLNAALGSSYIVYKDFIHNITNAPLNLKEDWRYYRDGHAWLCKMTHKSKTVFWLSVYEGYFKTTFYFSHKNTDDIAALPVGKKTKEAFATSKSVGKLIPLTIVIKDKKPVTDILKLVEYKVSKL